MSVSEHVRRARRVGGAVLVGCLAGACGDPLGVLPAPNVRALRIFLILDPDAPTQAVLAQRVSRISEPLTDLIASLTNGTDMSFGVREPESGPDEYRTCYARYGGLVGRPACLVFNTSVGFGKSYSVTVTAKDLATATATTTVPGNFTIVARSTTGAAQGNATVRATWTRSSGTYRYVVALRGTYDDRPPDCYPDVTCYNRWYAVTTDTTIEATLVGKNFEGGATAPWTLDVYAMNRDAYGYLMTGSGGDFFAIPPEQNVTGGYGGVGAWVRRSVSIF